MAAGSPLPRLVVVAGYALLVVLLVYGTGQTRLRGRPRWAVVGLAAVGGGLLALEVLAPGAIAARVGVELGEVVPIAGLAAVALGGYSVYRWWQARRQAAATPETRVTFDLGGGDRG